MICLRNQRAPSVIPCVEGGRRNSGFLSYGYERLCRAVVNNVDVVALVDTLFFSCRPAAVLRGVWAVIINALNAVFGARPATNISNKFFKRIFPALTNKYTSFSVVFVRLIRRVYAALSHVHPTYVFWAVRQAVANFRLGYLHPGPTPAASAFSAIEVAGMDVLFFAAYATARNIGSCVFSVGVGDNSPVSKGCPDGGVRKFHYRPLFRMTPLHYSGCFHKFSGV